MSTSKNEPNPEKLSLRKTTVKNLTAARTGIKAGILPCQLANTRVCGFRSTCGLTIE